MKRVLERHPVLNAPAQVLRIARIEEAVQRLDELRDGQLLRLADLRVDDEVRVGLDLEPRPLGRNDPRRDHDLHRRVDAFLEIEPRRTRQLRDDDSLAAIDDEGALVGHQGQVAQIDLGLDLLPIFAAEPHGGLDRSLERHVALPALLDGVLGVAQVKTDEFYKIRLCEVPNRGKCSE